MPKHYIFSSPVSTRDQVSVMLGRLCAGTDSHEKVVNELDLPPSYLRQFHINLL